MLENHQSIIKELQITSNQITEPVHKISFNLFKTYEQKLEELKTSFDRSLHLFNYSLTHCHTDVKETKEEVTYMKNRVINSFFIWNLFAKKLWKILKIIFEHVEIFFFHIYSSILRNKVMTTELSFKLEVF